MAKVRGAIVVDNEECKGCGLCVVACPHDVLGQNKQVNSKGYHFSRTPKVVLDVQIVLLFVLTPVLLFIV